MQRLGEILARYTAVGDDTKGKVLGGSFIVVNKDGHLYEASAGRIGLPIDSPSFNSQSSGWIASMTKIVTTVALLQLVEKELVKLDDDVRPLIQELSNVQLLKGFDNKDAPILEDNKYPITVRQLLSHSGGMSYDLLHPELQKWSAAISRSHNALDHTRQGWNTPLKFRPGESWTYGSGIDWAGLVLEKVTGQSLGAYMSENIFEPLGMSDTTFNREEFADKLSGRIIELAYRNPDGSLRTDVLPVPENPPVHSGGAGLFSTASDYSAFLQAVIAAGEGQATILRKDTVDEMFRPQFDGAAKTAMQTALAGNLSFPVTEDLNHGLGGAINTGDVDGKRRKGTLTWGGMSSSQWWIDRKAGIAAVLFVNLMGMGDDVVPRLYSELEEAVYLAISQDSQNQP